MIRVIVHGALGKLGQEVVRAVSSDPETKLVGAVDFKAGSNDLPLPDGSGHVPFSADTNTILNKCPADVMFDSTIAKTAMPDLRLAAKKGINLVIATTGFTADDLDEMKKMASANKIGIIIAPNFALGSVLMLHLAKIAAKYMDYAEIIELHHHLKADAPSGTALNTAKAMAAAKGKPFESPPEMAIPSTSRGQEVDGVPIHAVRLPGLMAHQEVIMGAPGQTLIIRHDTINRECYVPGIMTAIKEAVKRREYIYGLDTLLNL